MRIHEAGRQGRPNDKHISKTKESKTRAKNKDHITRQSTTTIKRTNDKEQEDNNQSKKKNQENNQHPAWNPDSRWTRGCASDSGHHRS